MSIPIEVLVGPVGAVGVLLLWVWDLRKERDEYKARFNRIIDKLEVDQPRTRAR